MDRDVVERIKRETDIVKTVSSYVALTRKGRSFWGCCPFHNEKTPSFHVEPERQIYKCFGCGAGGDVINFVMEVKGLTFVETVQELGAALGIAVELGGANDRQASARKDLYRLNRLAMEYYKRMLTSPQGQAAREYLLGRGLPEAVIERFCLGYAGEAWDGLAGLMRRKGASLEMAEKGGLLLRRKDASGFYDRFRDRVMFPIFDLGGEVVGFGGRVMSTGEPKYLNTSETPLFEKRRILFNLFEARSAIREKGVVVVEGYMDVISLAAAGFERAVATLGTALTEDHIRLITRFTEDITLVFDGDEAGRRAMLKALEPFMSTSLIPKVVRLPKGQDPDDIARQGLDLWNELLGGAESIWDLIFNESFSDREPSKLEDQNAIIKELGPLVARVTDQMVQALLIERLAVRLMLSVDTLASRIRFEKAEPAAPLSEREPGGGYKDIEETLLRLMLFDSDAVRAIRDLDLTDQYENVRLRPLFEYVLENGSAAFDSLDCPDEIRRLGAPLLAKGPLEGESRKALSDTLTSVMDRAFEREIKRLQLELAEAQSRGQLQRAGELARLKQEKLLARRNIKQTVAEVL